MDMFLAFNSGIQLIITQLMVQKCILVKISNQLVIVHSNILEPTDQKYKMH